MKTLDNIPLISVILPVYNNALHLPSCIESLLNQSYKNIEIIAIDDFSRDDSYKFLKLFRKLDKRLKVYRNVKHYGSAMTLNRAVRRVKGQFVAVMDPEDIAYKDRLKKQVNFLLKNPKIVAVGTQCTYIDEKDKKIGKTAFPYEYDSIYHKPLHGVSLQFETMMINRFLLPKDLLYFNTSDNSLLYSDILMKLLQFGRLANMSHPPLQYHRKHTVKNNLDMQQLPSLVKLWIKSVANSDYRPSFRYLSNAFLKSLPLAK